MDNQFKKLLNEVEPGKAHGDLLRRLNGLVEGSRKRMCDYYPVWDRHDDIYRSIKPQGQDKSDRKASERKEPEKFVVPVAHAQIQTFVAFCFSVLFQREYFFELTPMGADASKAAKVGEALLQRDLDHYDFRGSCYQFLLDVARFGVGVLKESWVEETKYVTQVTAPTQLTILGVGISFGGGSPQRTKVPAYQGNKVVNVSPYRFFPDPSLPITRFQEGEFCASEDEYTYTQLKQMEADGAVSGIDKIPNIDPEKAAYGRKNSRLVSVSLSNDKATPYAYQSSSSIIVTEIIWRCIPNQVEFGEGKLGPEKDVCKYLIWIANDARIIRAERYGYDHDEFCYSVGQFSPDLHHFLNEGLSGTIDCLQDVVSWFVNSHITSVRKVIQNLLVVDPKAIEMDDLANRNPVIRVKAGANRLGIEKYIQQLQLQDVTQNHMEDAKTFQNLIQITTGISDAALGQFYTGRRSATEAKNVNTGTSSRLKMHITLLFYSALNPLGRRMLSNLRQGLTLKTYVKIFGVIMDPQMKGYMEFAQVSKEDLQGDLDFESLDGTLPSEKQYQAQTLMECLQELIANPQLAMAMGFDVKKIFFEVLELRGIRHPEQFMLDQAQMLMAQQAMMLAQQQQTTSPNGQPNQQNQQPTQPGGVPQLTSGTPSAGA